MYGGILICFEYIFETSSCWAIKNIKLLARDTAFGGLLERLFSLSQISSVVENDGQCRRRTNYETMEE
jgi:hypothetical protein